MWFQKLNFLAIASLLLASLSILADGFSSSRLPPNDNEVVSTNNHVDPQLGRFLDKFRGGGGGGPSSGADRGGGSKGEEGDTRIADLQDYRKLVDDIITRMGEDIAEDSTNKCIAARVPIDKQGLKNDVIACMQKSVKIVFAKGVEIALDFSDRNVDREFQVIKQALISGQPLTPKQKTFVTNNLLSPTCATMKPVRQECQKPEYTHLVEFDKCKTDVERDGEEWLNVIIDDVCRNNAAWIFDFLDAKPLECVKAIEDAVRSSEWTQCQNDLEQYSKDPRNPGQKVKRIETSEQMCNVTGTLGDCLSDTFINSCEANPKPGQVLLNTFSDTRSWWAGKCSSASSLISWSSTSAMLLLMLIPNLLAQSLSKMSLTL